MASGTMYLIAAERQAGIAVVALGKDVDRTAEMRGEALQVLDGRRAEGQQIAGKFFKHGRGLQKRISPPSTYSKLSERCCLTSGREGRPVEPWRLARGCRST